MKWLALATQVIDKIPFERLLVRRPDNKERLQEIAEILGKPHAKPAEKPPEEPMLPQEEVIEETHPANLGNLRPKVHLASREGALSIENTVIGQNREIGKLLLRMERHYAQRMRHNGVPCDCGSQKHLLDLESLCEETVPMVDNPNIYYHVLGWLTEVGPKSTDEAAKSGKYDNEYPTFSHQSRDFRKEIIGTIDAHSLWPGSRVQLEDIFKKNDQEDAPRGEAVTPVVSEKGEEPQEEKGKYEMP